MANFKVGQKVVCIHDGEWYHADDGSTAPCHPKYNDVITISDIVYTHKSMFLLFEEYPPTPNCDSQFHSSGFRPITYTTDAIPEILKNFSPKEETSDVPCKEVVNQNQQ